MDYEIYLKIFAKVLQILGLIFSSTAILGENRLKRLNTIGRKFRKLVKMRLFLRVTKPYLSIILLISLGILIVIRYPMDTPSYIPSTAPPDIKFVLLISSIMSLLLFLGMTHIAISSISKSSIINTYTNRLIGLLSEKWWNTPWWEKFKQSWIYIFVYYLIYTYFYTMVISPLRTMHFLVNNGAVKVVFKRQKEHYELLFLPTSIVTSQVPRSKLVWRSMSWNKYLNLFQFLHVKRFLLSFFVLYFYPIYIEIILILWLSYYFFMFMGVFLIPTVLSLYFFIFYIVLWLLINTATYLLSATLFLLALPYKVFELLRIKARLRGGLLTLGLLLGFVGILID